MYQLRLLMLCISISILHRISKRYFQGVNPCPTHIVTLSTRVHDPMRKKDWFDSSFCYFWNCLKNTDFPSWQFSPISLHFNQKRLFFLIIILGFIRRTIYRYKNITNIFILEIQSPLLITNELKIIFYDSVYFSLSIALFQFAATRQLWSWQAYKGYGVQRFK